jgi:alginate O-acetyltransferase complex protein AlgI
VTFASPAFAAFYVLVFAAYFGLARGRPGKLAVILLANVAFFATWNPGFLPVLLATGIADFWIARALRSPRAGPRARQALLWASIALNVGTLVVFRYLDSLLGLGSLGGFALLAPVGISFYVFQSMSYTLDVYHGLLEPSGDLLEFLAALTFFPHLLAGPIVRCSFLLPQFASARAPTRREAQRSLALIMVGLLKKVLADALAARVDLAYAHAGPQGLVQSWAAVLGFAAQIYGDFSGYTDMATGLALLLGFELPENFALPYLSASPAEYFRRWHISLSTWFRDYLYYPLALGPLRAHPYLSIVAVMSVAGLWHGAGTRFAAFGLYHGVMLAGTQWCSARWGDPLRGRAVKTALTFYVVLVGQVIFRAPGAAALADMLAGMHGFGASQAFTPREGWTLAAAAAALVAGHSLDYVFLVRRWLEDRPFLLRAAAAAAFFLAMAAGSRPSFIYFQF